jgi:hypothetical protein
MPLDQVDQDPFDQQEESAAEQRAKKKSRWKSFKKWHQKYKASFKHGAVRGAIGGILIGLALMVAITMVLLFTTSLSASAILLPAMAVFYGVGLLSAFIGTVVRGLLQYLSEPPKPENQKKEDDVENVNDLDQDLESEPEYMDGYDSEPCSELEDSFEEKDNQEIKLEEQGSVPAHVVESGNNPQPLVYSKSNNPTLFSIPSKGEANKEEPESKINFSLSSSSSD